VRVDTTGCEDDVGNECFRFAEFPGLLMNSSDSMASCSRTFWWGEKRMGSTNGVLAVACLGVPFVDPVSAGVLGLAWRLEWDKNVGVNAGFELRRGLGLKREGWMVTAGARYGAGFNKDGGDMAVAELAFGLPLACEPER
jgi:hypothetical protein